jgi:hypothetical protein
MAYPRELLDSAMALHRSQPETQAALRRAVSTAYYALFHFLVEEACGNWMRPEQRPRLARMFEHRNMFNASNRRIAEFRGAAPGAPESRLYSVAFAFRQLQDNRHFADYDLSATLSRDDVALDLKAVEEVFATWQEIREEQIAQDYLFSLLFKDRA